MTREPDRATERTVIPGPVLAGDDVAAALGKIAYSEKPGATIDDPIPWEATGSDAQGDRMVFKGTAEKDAMTGTITITLAKGAPHIFTFAGGKSGTDAAIKAVGK